MLVNVPLAKTVRHKSAATNRCASDVQQHIPITQFCAVHLIVRFIGDVGYVVEPKSIKMDVLATKQRHACIKIAC